MKNNEEAKLQMLGWGAAVLGAFSSQETGIERAVNESQEPAPPLLLCGPPTPHPRPSQTKEEGSRARVPIAG